jgi:predicted NAD/FAD-dependent oxidoreductase
LPGKALAQGSDVRLETQVSAIKKQAGHWALTGADGESLGAFDWVIVATPAEQALQLLPEVFGHTQTISDIRMLSCYTVMLGFEQPLDLPWQAALVHNADISWVSVNSSKPGREGPFTLLIHATNAWSDEHINDDIDQVKRHLLAEISQVVGADTEMAAHSAIHRWRYANANKRREAEALVDPINQLAACGDWCVHGRVEGAFISAMALLREIGSK